MKPIRTAILTASYACLAFLYVSCVREDTGDCMQYEIHVRVVDAAGNDLTQSGVLEKSEVYLFGENGFVRMVPAGVSSDYLFGNHKEARLTLVAWGNIKEDTLITAKIKPGTLLEEARLKLKQHAEGSHLPVTDLFYCRKEPEQHRYKEHTRGKITLVMERMTAGLSIRTRYLAERYPYQGETYTFIVRGTGSEVDFMGKVTGENARYKPPTFTDEQGDAYAPPFAYFQPKKKNVSKWKYTEGRKNYAPLRRITSYTSYERKPESKLTLK